MKLKRWMPILAASLIWASFSLVAYGQILHTQRVDQTITKGVKLISESILTDAGWQDIDLLKINLGSGNVEIRPIESTNLGEKKTVLQLANENKAIAGINADFFDMSATHAVSFGPVIQNGELKHSYNYKYTNLGPKKNMATFMLDQNNNVLMDYYGIDISLSVNQTKLFDMTSYNKQTSTLGRPLIIDSTYYKDNTTLTNKYKSEGVYTVIIEDDLVTYCSRQDEIVNIPTGAKAILLSSKDASTYYPLLQVGTEVEITENVTLNNQVIEAVEQMKMGIGGGGLLMKDGKAYTGPAHTVSPTTRQPRTIIATTNNSQEILLITIDGRNNTLGATHKELPEILSRYGVKDAMYLDGGGSTTLVARNEGESNLTLQNKPSDGVERKVTNGIGVFSTAPQGTLNKLYIKADSDRTFIGESITFKVTGVDEYNNPITLDQSEIKMSVTGVSGNWKGLTFYPESAGKGLILAEVGGMSVATEIIITEGPVGLYIEPSYVQLKENGQGKVQVYGVDKAGYKIPVTLEKVEWISNNQNVTATAGNITGTNKAVATLKAKYKNATATVGVTVGESVVAVESFESSLGKWAGSSSTVTGKIESSKEIKYHGEQSLKMSYTFDKDPGKQVAYAVFDKPIQIPTDTRSINLWVYAKGQPDTLKVQLQDSEGKTHYLKLANSLEYDGWKYQSVTIPESVKLPAKVTKAYVYSNGNTAKRENAIYIDHMSITRGSQTREGIYTRDDYRYDPFYKASLGVATGNDYSIKVAGTIDISSMKLTEQDLTSIGNKLSTDANMVILASKSNTKLPINKNTYSYNNEYSSLDYQDTKVMFLGTDSGGLRKTNVAQWTQMKQSLEKTGAKHIILVMSKNPLTQFSDDREGKALHQYLKELRENTGKNIFVVYPGGTEKEVRIEDSIRYIRVNGLSTLTDQPKDGEVLKFKVHEGSIYYTFEPIM